MTGISAKCCHSLRLNFKSTEKQLEKDKTDIRMYKTCTYSYLSLTSFELINSTAGGIILII